MTETVLEAVTTTQPGAPIQERPAGRRRLRRNLTPALMLAPSIIVVGAVIVVPIVTVFVESLFDVNPSRHAGWLWAGMHNYTKILHDDELGGVLLNTAIWTIGSVILQFVLAFAAALLVRGALAGKAWAWLRASYVLPWATPMIVGAIAWKWLYQPQYGLLNSALDAVGLDHLASSWLSNPDTALYAVLLTNVWRGFPFIMVLLLSGMAAISPDIYEAASVDGASPMQQTWQITLPLLRPQVLLSTLLSLIWTFNNFSLIYVMTGGGPAGSSDILTTYVYKNAFQRFDLGYASALSVVLFLIVAVGSALYVRALDKETLE